MYPRFIEDALKENLAQLASVVSLVGAVGVLDREGRLLMKSGKLAHFWGDQMPAYAPAADGSWRSVDVGDGLLHLAEYPESRALRGETVFPGLEFVHTNDVGDESWLRVSAAPYRIEGGDILGAVAVLEDLSDEKRDSRLVREGAARLKAAVDLVGLGLYSWNPQSNEVLWDDAVRTMWGLPSRAKGDFSIWRGAIHPDDLETVDEALRTSLDASTEGVFDVEYRVIGYGDGIERWVATRGLATFVGGKAIAFDGVVVDISDRKRAEDALEQRVEARTRELNLLNRQLQEQIARSDAAEAAALQLSRVNAIGQITSGIAHDFNNLIAIVLSNARLLQLSIQDPEDREGLELIQAAAERGAKIVAQLLAYGRKQQLAAQVVDLNAQIIGMTDLLRATLGQHIHLDMALAPDLKAAVVDPTQVEMILLNLAINARDAMPDGGRLIVRTFNTVAAEPTREEHPPAGEYSAIFVEDTGEGISDDVLPHVFEPFYTTKTLGAGSGLGLAQVLGVLKQSSGGASIEGRIGKGTSVIVYLPISKTTKNPQGQ